MKISIIIPVYNAERYLIKAVESALQQEETGEVLLIEDNSPDDSLKICTDLEQQYKKVKLYRHPNGLNQGAGATRNLGIKKAACEYVAFLDADDYYLPGRFKTAKALFERHPDIDGVYEAIGMHFYDDKSRAKWFASGENELTTLTKRIESRKLFEALLTGGHGYLHLDGLSIKKTIFDSCDLFIEKLRLHQDTAMFLQMALSGKLVPGNIATPVAKRGVHNENRILSAYHRSQTVFLLWKNVLHWAYRKRISNDRMTSIFYNYMYYAVRLAKEKPGISKKIVSLIQGPIKESIMHPVLFLRAISYLIQNRLRLK